MICGALLRGNNVRISGGRWSIEKGRVLLTGGAGFIGSHAADALLAEGYAVRVLDNLSPQVHGGREAPPDYLNPGVEFVRGDVRDAAVVDRALRDVDAVLHLAAAVGVGQSMYQVEDYVSTNTLGTAVLLQALLRRPVGRLVVASSMSVYGEGLYRDRAGRLRPGGERPLAQLRRGAWELLDDRERPLEPLPTPETKTPALASVYALSKFDQERMCLLIGRAYGIPVAALRFFNVYGPRQALSNPYTGVMAIFAARYLNDRPPLVFEDGGQMRDFVHVSDVAAACVLALTRGGADSGVFNIGSGRSRTVREVAEAVGRAVGKDHIAPVVTGRYRVGDIRHCFADIGLARARLGFEPRVGFEEGVAELAFWLREQTACDRVDAAAEELRKRGLTL